MKSDFLIGGQPSKYNDALHALPLLIPVV